MAYPQWVAPQPLNFMDNFGAGWNVGAQMASEPNARQGFGALAEHIYGGANPQRAQQQPMGLAALGSSGYAPPNGGFGEVSAAPTNVVAGSHAAVQGATDPFLQSLIRTESGGNWAARNNATGAGGAKGHFGRVQFGHARLQDAMRAGAIPQGTTPEQFMSSPNLQTAAENWHFADINRQIGQRGLDRYIGQNVGGVPITREAIMAMAHLGGIGGAQRYLESGGQHNPADANGTSLRDYARIHGGAGGGQERTRVASIPSTGAPTQFDSGPNTQQATMPGAVYGQPSPQNAAQAVNTMAGAPAGPAQAFSGGGGQMNAQMAPQQPMGGFQPVPGMPQPTPQQPGSGLPPREVMEQLFRSPETRPLAIQMAQQAMAGQQVDQFQTFMRDDGSIWQMNAQTGAIERLQGPGEGQFSLGANDTRFDASGNLIAAGRAPEVAPMTPEQRAQWGIPPSDTTPYYLDNGVPKAIGGGGVNVNIGQGEVGNIPPGYELFTDPDTGARSMRPIQGGPIWQEQQDASDQDESRRRQAATQGVTVIQDAGIALSLADEISGLAADPGPVGANIRRMQANIAGTPEYRMQRFVNSALANVGFDQLNQMRQNSPTGGALGNVTELQLRQLESVLGQYDIGLHPDEQKFILQRISNAYADIVFGSRQERQQAVADGKMTQEDADYYDQFYYADTRDPMGRPLPQQQGEGAQGGQQQPAAQQPTEYTEGTIIENEIGQRMVMRNGRWEFI